MKKSTKIILIVASIVAVAIVGLSISAAFLLGSSGIYKVQLIPIRGEISAFGTASSQQIVKAIKDADSDPMTKAIILEINSPGGSVVASEEISTAIEASETPVIAWLREVAASGGYWIASSTDYIVADPATITGSIGVTASYLQFSGLMEKYGVEYEQINSGKLKEAGSPYKDLSTDERALLQGKVNLIKDMFISHVSRTRKMEWKDVEKLATGEIFLGIEAKQVGLVDELGGKETAFAAAKRLADVENARLDEPSSAISSLLQQLLQPSSASANSQYVSLILNSNIPQTTTQN